MFKGAKKEDLRLIAKEIGENVTDKMTVIELLDVIKNNERYKKDPDTVTEVANSIVEDRKSEEQKQLEFEKIKLERTKMELEIARIRVESKSSNCEEPDSNSSLDCLIKSIRTLTMKVPCKPENWGFYFTSLERAFMTKNVPEKYKSEILLNLLGEKASNIISYIRDDDINEYDKVKALVLREFEPTPQSCLEHFRKANKQSNETYTQFASRLTTSWDYYLKLRKVSDFESLKQLIVSGKMYQTLVKETALHISVRQSDTWFESIKLGKEIDLYLSS